MSIVESPRPKYVGRPLSFDNIMRRRRELIAMGRINEVDRQTQKRDDLRAKIPAPIYRYERIPAHNDTPDELLNSGQIETIIPTLQSVKNAVVDEFNIPLLHLLSQRRSVSLSLPRQIGMWVAREMTNRSFPEIGRSFGRDHTTVMHAARKIDSLIDRDAEIRRHVDRIRLRLSGSFAIGHSYFGA